MKNIIGVLAFSTALLGCAALSGSAAFAGQNDDLVARLNAADQENAAIRKPNLELTAAKPAKPVSLTDKMADFFGAYAADLPVAYKAPPLIEPGRLSVWVEGGAIWTGGDPVSRDFFLTDFTTFLPSFEGVSSTRSIPGIFDLTPKIGWEAATGFDYKFAGSPWHVSGQFRYGEGGKTSGIATSSGTLDPFFLPRLSGLGFSYAGAVIGGSETFAVSYKETHWLADLALGYDVAGHGPSAMQVKGGIRISEFVSQTNTSDRFSSFVNFANPVNQFQDGSLLSIPPTSSITYTAQTTEDIRNSFLGAGPLIGLEGSLPFLGAWSFDYKGDLAVLFGTQKSVETSKTITSITPALLRVITMSQGYNHIYTDSEARFATMLSGDIQAGVSYWFTRNLKLGLSYRIDALMAVKNTKSANANSLLIPDRFWHGPRLTLAGQF